MNEKAFNEVDPMWASWIWIKFVSSIIKNILFIQHTFGASQVALVEKNPLANAEEERDASLIPGLGRPPGEGNGYPP